MNVLVIGSNGQLGRELYSAISQCELRGGAIPTIVLANRDNIDLVKRSKIFSFLTQIAPDFIVNAAAYTTVDKAESEEKLAFAVNGISVGEMVKYC